MRKRKKMRGLLAACAGALLIGALTLAGDNVNKPFKIYAGSWYGVSSTNAITNGTFSDALSGWESSDKVTAVGGEASFDSPSVINYNYLAQRTVRDSTWYKLTLKTTDAAVGSIGVWLGEHDGSSDMITYDASGQISALTIDWSTADTLLETAATHTIRAYSALGSRYADTKGYLLLVGSSSVDIDVDNVELYPHTGDAEWIETLDDTSTVHVRMWDGSIDTLNLYRDLPSQWQFFGRGNARSINCTVGNVRGYEH